MRNGGKSSGKVSRTISPVCQRFPASRDWSARGGRVGNAARIAVNARFTYGCNTAFVTEIAPSLRARPSAGWKRVTALAVPVRTYSWGGRAGCLRVVKDRDQHIQMSEQFGQCRRLT